MKRGHSNFSRDNRMAARNSYRTGKCSPLKGRLRPKKHSREEENTFYKGCRLRILCSCNVWQYVAVRCKVLQCVAEWFIALQCGAVRYNALPCVAVRCSVLQCAAVCCSTLHFASL